MALLQKFFEAHRQPMLGDEPERPEHALTIPGAAAEVLERPRLASGKAMVPKKLDARAQGYMEEYVELAAQVGIKAPDMKVEEFKRFLDARDIPVFNLTEVALYMDKKAAAEAKNNSGWLWRPLRAADNRRDMIFGTSGRYTSRSDDPSGRQYLTGRSDFFEGPTEQRQRMSGMRLVDGGGTVVQSTDDHEWETSGGQTYDRTIPLHALRKVALITKEFKGDVALFVSDYAPELSIVPHPDPFLMAVVPNPDVHKGTGRLVIDFWDEPGFGIEQMLK